MAKSEVEFIFEGFFVPEVPYERFNRKHGDLFNQINQLPDIRGDNDFVVKIAIGNVHSDTISKKLLKKIRDKYPNCIQRVFSEADGEYEEVRFYVKYKDMLLDFFLDTWNIDSQNSTDDNDFDLIIHRSIRNKIANMLIRRKYWKKEAYSCYPVFEGRDFGIDPDFCFVLMPFSENWSERIWRKHIEPTVAKEGFQCYRSDSIFQPGVIIEQIWESLNRSAIVIADLTAKNANVFYELGIVHTIGVPTILISQNKETLAFDINHWRHVFYEDNSEGCEALEKTLSKILKSFREDMTRF